MSLDFAWPLTYITNSLKWIFGDTPLEVATSTFYLSIICYVAWRLILRPIYRVFADIWGFWRQSRSLSVCLEITPPTTSEKSSLATEQLFGIIKKLIGKHETLSLEIVSSYESGIRYRIQTPPHAVDALQRHIASYLPEARFEIFEETSAEQSYAAYRVFDIRQFRHYAYPLQAQDQLGDSDPIAYITGAMVKLEPGESIEMQMVIAPYSSRKTLKLYNEIYSKGYAVIDHKFRYFLKTRPKAVWIVPLLFLGILPINWIIAFCVFIFLLVISLFFKPQPPELTPYIQELYAGVLQKLGQPLFKTDIRILVGSNTQEGFASLTHGAISSLAPLNVAGFQELHAPTRRPFKLFHKIVEYKFRRRLPSLFTMNSNILSASELASLYHFPYDSIGAEGMVKSHARSLPAPLSQKVGDDFDVVLGINTHHGSETAIGLTTKERERHTFIIGGTGNGKTTLLQYAIVQDIQNGKGLAVVDPHGDMAETLLGYVPEERVKDVIYFNPDDLAHPIGMNLLELTPGLEGDDLLREKDLATESVVSIFRKIFSDDDSGGHRIEYVLRNAIHTALTVEDATLFTVYDLLNNPTYRKKVVAELDDEDLKNFWKNEIGKAGGMQQVKMMAGITTKIGRFLFSASAKRILEQPKSTINFDEILDGKILICNFSKGLLGEDTSELLGIAILAKLQLASLRRARIKQKDRKSFYLYVDEFQNFATPSFVQMLSEARKYKLFLTMAEQSTSQQDDQRMVNTILANVGTVITFRTANPADEKLLLPLFEPYIEKGEIASLSTFNFYMRIAAHKTQEPLSGETIVLEDEGDEEIASKVVQTSRKTYGVARESKKPRKAASSTAALKSKPSPKKLATIPTQDGLKNHSRNERKPPSNITLKPKRGNNK